MVRAPTQFGQAPRLNVARDSHRPRDSTPIQLEHRFESYLLRDCAYANQALWRKSGSRPPSIQLNTFSFLDTFCSHSIERAAGLRIGATQHQR